MSPFAALLLSALAMTLIVGVRYLAVSGGFAWATALGKVADEFPDTKFGIIDMVVAAMSSALRRAEEMAEAITARGGTGRLTAYPSRPHRRDWFVLGIVAVACAGAITATVLL